MMKNYRLENSTFSAVFAADSVGAAHTEFYTAFPGQFGDPPSYVETDDAASTADDIAAQRAAIAGENDPAAIDAAALAADAVESPEPVDPLAPGPDSTPVTVIDPAHDLGPQN